MTARVQGGTIYSDPAAFVAALQPGLYVESFDGLPASSPNLGPAVSFASGAFSYDAYASSALWALLLPGAGDIALSTNSSADPLAFTYTSGNFSAVGGFFFPAGFDGFLVPGTVTLSFSDGHFEAPTDPLITSLTVDANDIPAIAWPTANDLYAGDIGGAAVPEPMTAGPIGVGLLLVCGLGLRRNRDRRMG